MIYFNYNLLKKGEQIIYQKTKNKVTLLLIAFVLSNVITAVLSCYICLQNTKQQVKDAYSEGFEDCLSTSSTFYAEILKITDNLVLAEGCDINGINKQGVYEFIISDNTIIKYNTTKLNTEFALSKLCTGDSVSITYSGGILEKDPAWLENVLVIEVLSNNF